MIGMIAIEHGIGQRWAACTGVTQIVERSAVSGAIAPECDVDDGSIAMLSEAAAIAKQTAAALRRLAGRIARGNDEAVDDRVVSRVRGVAIGGRTPAYDHHV